jgi:hypothetical protein
MPGLPGRLSPELGGRVGFNLQLKFAGKRTVKNKRKKQKRKQSTKDRKETARDD